MHESGEMYLETIYVLSGKKPVVRSIDVADEMGFSKHNKNASSISGNCTQLAKKIYERHTVLTELLVKFGVNKETAEEDACKIEHVISDETFVAIKEKLKEL